MRFGAPAKRILTQGLEFVGLRVSVLGFRI